MNLQKQMNNYLTLRRSLGFKLHYDEFYLSSLIRFLKQSKTPFINPKIALLWAQQSKSRGQNSISRRLQKVRPFAHYLHAQDSRHKMIPKELSPPCIKPRWKPYIYSDHEVATLMKGIKNATKTPFRGVTYSTMIGLLAATGMRVSEVINLDCADVDPKQNTLHIRHSKFGKSRLIPLHVTVAMALEAYAKQRDAIIPRASSPAFFLSCHGRRIIHVNFHFVFHKLTIALGMNNGKLRTVRIHDLRHTFAIKTITSWYQAGLKTEPLLPALSTYLGHVAPDSTYHYLHATPDLLRQASLKLESTHDRGLS